MAEDDEILYESLDSGSPVEDMEEYITVSTPLPYLCPEVPHRLATPTSAPQFGSTSGDAPLFIPREELKLKPPIQPHFSQEGQVGRKNFSPMPIPAPYKLKGERPVPPNKADERPPEWSKATSLITKPMPSTDYHRLVEDGSKPSRRLPKPPCLPKPKLSLKSSKKKAYVRYSSCQLKSESAGQESQHNAVDKDHLLTRPDQHPTEEQNEDEVYYDQVLSRTKWRNILKRKNKMKVASKKPIIKSVSAKASHGSDCSAFSAHSSMAVSSTKKEFEYSDDELKLKAGSPRIICILLTIIIIALMVAVVSLTVSLVSISSVMKLSYNAKNGVPTINCDTLVNSSREWQWVSTLNNSYGTIELTHTMDIVSSPVM